MASFSVVPPKFISLLFTNLIYVLTVFLTALPYFLFSRRDLKKVKFLYSAINGFQPLSIFSCDNFYLYILCFFIGFYYSHLIFYHIFYHFSSDFINCLPFFSFLLFLLVQQIMVLVYLVLILVLDEIEML